MRFGVMVPNWAPFDHEMMIRIAVEGEELGYDHIFYTDHPVHPYADTAYMQREFPDLTTVETWALISHVAAKTTRIRLGTGVTPMPLRPPGLLAKQIATIDRLSQGRVFVGVGTGWHPGSFRLVGTEFGSLGSRRARQNEIVGLMRQLWTGERSDFAGEHYAIEGGLVQPPPIQDPVPLWAGGHGGRQIEFVASAANGWIPWHRPFDFYADAVADIKQRAAAAGRTDRIEFGYSDLLVADEFRDDRTPFGKDIEPPNLTVSTVGEAVERAEAAGAEHFVFLPFPADHALELIRGFAAEIIGTPRPAVR
jgi:probable F420-dependent oxidoreductase